MMNVQPLLRLADKWDEEADLIEQWQGDQSAEELRTAAEKLRRAVNEWLNEPLPIDVAAEESGYSKSRLRKLAGSEVPNAGQEGDPRIRRKHLPLKPGHTCGGSPSDTPAGSRSQVARSVLNSD